MNVTTSQLIAISRVRPPKENVDSIVAALATYGAKFGLDRPHRLAHYVCQLAHESGGFRYDREIWGPTAAQKGYEGRKDLGNTIKGDGSKFRGYGPLQVTGRANVTRFYNWCVKQSFKPPDFVANPALINTDPWEGLSPLWYWETGNPSGKSLNVYADANNIEMITRRINGGLNGYAERVEYYTRTGLVFLGYAPNDVRGFQTAAKIPSDGIAGPQTRAAIHAALMRSPVAVVVPFPQPVEPVRLPPDYEPPEPEKAATGFWASLAAWWTG